MRRLLITTLVLFSLLGGTALAQQFSTLEERMTEAEFKAAGLDKLSAEELAQLNAWLAGKVSSGAATAQMEDRRGFPTSTTTDNGTIVTSFTGEFRGWDGKGSRIRLANGQVWEVTDSTSKLKVLVNDPTVFIEPGILGSWYLRVDGYNTRARVKRIR
ncbi:hypothetical protein [Arenimonas sp. MALMAid1274]|uniref:hypothetical protein n=1 Tax=Arenimonas sp. MALMAid1274 TaxID=3411630 RepID=UPI003BA19556